MIGFPVAVGAKYSSVDATEGEMAERSLIEGGAAGNLKSNGGNCGLLLGTRDGSIDLIGLGVPEPPRWLTSTFRLPGDGLTGNSRGGPRVGRPPGLQD